MNNMRRSNGTSRDSDELMRKIAALGFTAHEIMLYLDTHPDCKMALDMYHKTLDELKILTENHKNLYGPIRAEDSVDTEAWSWVNMPWPWQRGNGATDGVGEGR